MVFMVPIGIVQAVTNFQIGLNIITEVIVGFIPPATPLTYMSWVMVGILFNFYIRRRFTGWWSNYNYLTSGGMDLGLALCLIVMFFAVSLPQKVFPDWWGTTVVANTLDTMDAAVQIKLPKGEIFGPPRGSWS